MIKKNLVTCLSDIQSNRISEVISIVKIAHPNPKSINAKFLNKSGNISIVITDRHINSQNPEDYDFQTIAENIRARYNEVWVKFQKDEYYLSKAYFHLYKIDEEYLTKRKDGEYILLHCDPNDNDDHGDYKRSPHIHIENSDYPINKAHIALNLSNIKEILVSRMELNTALQKAVLMIKDQILTTL